MTRMQSCWNRFLWIVAVLLAISGCFQRSTVSSLSARPPRRNHHCTHSQQSIDDPLPQNGGVSRRDWLVAGACSGLLWSNNHAAAAADSQPRLAPEYYDPSNVVTDPSAGRSYFPALTPPFFDRATYKYTLGRNTWALEQLLTFANVTATIRTTVVKLQSTGGLWVHSPQWPTGEFCALLESIGGPVEHVVLPCNAFEHKAPLQAFVERYPNAKVWIAPGQYGPLGSCGITLSDKNNRPQMGYKVDGILGDANSPPPPWSDEFDIATLYIDLPRNAGPVSEVAFCHRPTKTLVTTDAVVYVPETPSGILETYFDKETLEIANFWPRSVLQAVFLPLREEQGRYPGYEALVNKLARAPILRAVVDARAPNAVRDWILEQTTTTKFLDGSKHWDYDRVVTSHFASPIEATPSDVRASFAYLLDEDLSSNSNNSKNSLPPIACQDWELLDSINQFIAKYNAGEPAVFDFQRGCVAE